jgi:hypothetical protein
MTRRLAPVVACLLLAMFAACGGDDDSETAATATPAPAPFDAKAVSKDLSTKPAVPATGGDPPSALEKTDIVEGNGKRAKATWTTSASPGRPARSSTPRGTAASRSPFPLGAGQVIPG